MTLAPSLRRAEVDDVSKCLLQTRTHAQAASRGHSLGVISSSAAESTDEILPTALDSLSHRHMSDSCHVSSYLATGPVNFCRCGNSKVMLTDIEGRH